MINFKARACIIVCTLFLSLFNEPLYCQKYTIGVKAGASISTVLFGDKDDKHEFSSSAKMGYFGAALINFPMKKDFSFQSEIGFAQRGRNIKFNEDTWSNQANYKYLEGGMVLRKSYPLRWASDINGTWFFNVGPRISYWLTGKGTVTAGGSYNYKVVFGEPPIEPSSPDFDKMYLTDVNRWLFGIDFGVGVDAPTRATQRFVFELRFTSGHTYYGDKDGAFNRTLGFKDNLRANEKIISLSIDYTLTKDVKEAKKGKSTKKDVKKSKSRKKFDSMLH